MDDPGAGVCGRRGIRNHGQAGPADSRCRPSRARRRWRAGASVRRRGGHGAPAQSAARGVGDVPRMGGPERAGAACQSRTRGAIGGALPGNCVPLPAQQRRRPSGVSAGVSAPDPRGVCARPPLVNDAADALPGYRHRRGRTACAQRRGGCGAGRRRQRASLVDTNRRCRRCRPESGVQAGGLVGQPAGGARAGPPRGLADAPRRPPPRWGASYAGRNRRRRPRRHPLGGGMGCCSGCCRQRPVRCFRRTGASAGGMGQGRGGAERPSGRRWTARLPEQRVGNTVSGA